ncbi:ani-2 [Pristionchus pacificus]|nr:ani-2 [Pristionchus pacificus]
MARGKRNNNNKRGRGGSAHNTTSDSDGNRSNIVHEGCRDVRDHKGFSTGAFGTSDIDGSGLQSQVIIERSEMDPHGRNTTEFNEEVHVPTRSRTSSLGADPNEGFLNPNDYALNVFGQNSQSSVRSRTSISNFEKAHCMSQLSIQTNQDEFVLVPGSGGHDGHASVRSMRSQASRQSANVAMSSRDDILTEGDETGGDELRDEGVRDRLDSRASQFSRGSAFGSPVEIPVEDQTVYRSRRQSENAGGEWESTQPAQDRRSHTSLYSHKSNGWPEGEVKKEYIDVPPQEAQNGYVHIPSRHSSRVRIHSRGADGWDQERGFGGDEVQVPIQPSRHASTVSLHSRGADGYDQEGGELRRDEIQIPIHLSRHASRASVHCHGAEGWDEEGGGFREEEIKVPIQLSRHASKASVMSHRSDVPDNVGFGDVRGYGSRAPSHHASKISVASHRSDVPDVSEYVEGAKFIGGQGLGNRAPSHHASKTSVYSSMSRGGAHMEDQWKEQTGGDLVEIPSKKEKNGLSRSESKISLKLDAPEVDEWDNNEQVFGGGGVSHASRHSLRSGYGSNAPSHHASKVSIHSHAGGDAGVAPFNASRPQSVHASRASIYSHAPDGTGSRAPSHHASRTSIHSHTAGEVGYGSRAPSHHTSRASIHSHAYCEEEEEVENEGMNGFIHEEEGRTNGTSGTSTRSRLSCIACADDTEEGLEEHEKLELPQLGDEIEVPPEAVDEWGEHVDEHRGEEERVMENGHFGDTGNEWRREDEIGDGFLPPAVNEEGRRQQRSAYGSRASIATHTVDVASIGGRSHHASRMSIRSTMGGVDENDDGRHGGLQQTTFGRSGAPIPAIRLSRASLNQPPTMDWNHNSMSNLHGGEFADENQLHIPSHHASKMSLRSVRSEMARDPMQTALSKMSIHSHQSAPREHRFSSNSTQDVAEWGATVNEDDDEEVFEHHGGYVEYDGGMSRGTSHRSIYSTRSSKAGEQTEENLLQAIINRSREPSLGSLADRPYIPPKDGWKSSTHSVKSTNEDDGKTRSRRESRSASVHLVGAGIDLPLNVPIPQSRSRSVSVTSRRSFDGVVFADQPELYSHPDDRFGGDKSIEGIPFRRTNEHEKTPQPTSKRGSRVFKHNESDDELRALVSSASHTSVVENTPPPSAGFNTPKSRNSRESYLGTADISMPSPSPFNQTQFQREEFEAFKERASRSSTTPLFPFSPSSEKNEMATQTGETIARAAGQRFALHYGGEDFSTTQSTKPRRGPSGLIPPSAHSSSYSVGPPPPPSCSPPHEEECTLQHHQPMENEEEERRRQHYAALYDHGDMGDVARKSSSHSSSRFAPLPTYDMSYVEQYEARSMASASKTTTTVSTASSSSTTLKSQYATGAASAASSYVDHLRPVQPSAAHTNVAMKGMGGARGGNSMEMTTTNRGYYRQEMSEALFSPSKETVAQKMAAFRQKEEEERGGMGTHEYSPVYANYLQRPVNRQVPIEMVRGDEIVVPVERDMHQQPKVVNVEIKRATSSVGQRPLQQSGYVHIERPKMNNSFERNNHPAAAVLNLMLSARASPNSSRSEDNPLLTRQPSSVGGTSGGYLPQPMGYVPPPPPLLPSYGGQSTGGMPKGVMTSPTTPGYQRSIRPLASEDATFHYEMKHDLSSQQIEKKTNEEISKDEQSVLSRVGAIRADISPQGMTQTRQPWRSREAERAYTSYHDKKSQGTSSVPLTSAPKPFTPSSPYRSAALGQQQQVYGAYRAMAVPQAPVKKPLLHPQTTRGGTTVEKEIGTEKKTAVGPIEQNKYTGSTIRRAIPQRGHIRNLAAAFDKVQTKADQEVTVIEPHNSSVEKRRGGTSTVGGPISSGRGGVGGSTSSTTSSRVFASRSDGMQQSGVGHGQDAHYGAPTGTTTTSGSTRVEEREERDEEYEMMRRRGYNERSIHEWQTANEQQMRQGQQREEQGWSGRDEDELLLDSESDRPVSIHSGGATRGRIIPAHVLRTSTPLAGVKNDPRSLARALEKIPSIRGDDTIGRGRGRDLVRGVRTGGVRALASRFEKAAEEETEKARSASMTPKLRRRESPRRVEGEDAEDRREAAARRLSRGMGGMERLEREREKRRSQSAHAAMRKRRSESTSDSGEESVMRDMEAVEKMAREDILRKEREEMRGRKAMKTATKNEIRRPSEEERKIDEMFHGLESQESAGERGTMASSRGTMSGGESVRTERQERQERGERWEEMHHPFHHQQQQLQHQHYQYQQQYREHHQHQHHHYQSHLQSVNQPSNAPHLQSIPSQQPPPPSAAHSVQQQQLQQRPNSPNYLASHLLPLGANGALEHAVVTRRESTQTMHQTTTNTQSSTATGLVYSPSVYRETGRALRGDVSAPANGLSSMIPMEKGRGDGRAATMDAKMTASSPHFSPVNIRGPETAGQRVATYESRDGRNPVRVPSRQVRPYALATSTPMGTVHSSNRGTTLVNEEGVVIPPDAVEDDSFLSTISNESRGSVVRSPANQAEYKKQISRLQTVQSMEEEKISITSKALAHARKKQNPSNELAAQRTILLARLRVAALKRELQRLSALAIVRNPPPPVNKSVLGAMDISDITLHLNRNLCARPGDGGSCSFGFIVVLKCGVEVEATAPVCILVPQRPAGVKVVHFPEHLRFSNLPVDFTIRLEVYVMKLREPKEESCTALLATKARNLLGPGTRRAAITAGPGGSSGSGGSPCAINGELPVGELVRCGNTALDRDSVGSMRLYLDAPEYPLEGTIELMSRCSRLPSSVEVDLRGFLTMYKVVGGYGSWVRYWAVLRRGVINFWKYPDDEQLDRGGPVASADLSKCTDSEIVPAPREICTRQFAFSIDMLVATTPSIVEKKRVLLAADSREFLKAWLAALNETLTAIRA